MSRIANISPTYLPARRANTIQVMKMSQAFHNLGHEVHLVVPHPGLARGVTLPSKMDPVQAKLQGDFPKWDDLASHYGIEGRFPITWLPANPRFRGYDFALQAVQWAKRLEANLLYTRLPQASALASIIGFPTIFEAHDVPKGYFGPFLFRRFLNGHGALRLSVITRALASDLTASYSLPDSPSFTVIAPDGVDLTRYQGLPDPKEARHILTQSLETSANGAKSILPDRFTVGYTGHLYEGRGVNLILSIAVQLPKFTFLIVGGEQSGIAQIRHQVAHMNLKNVIVTGFIPNAHLPIYQAACDILLMPYQKHVSASSGGDIAPYLSPMKLFEYLACGRGIVSSNLPVLQEVLNPSNAILLSPEDPENWVAALVNLYENPENIVTLATQARLDAQKYTWESRAERVLQGLIQ